MNNYTNLVFQIYKNLDSKRRNELLILIILIVISSFLEIVSLGSFLPLLQSLVSENKSDFLRSVDSFIASYSNIKPIYLIGLGFLLVFNLNDFIRSLFLLLKLNVQAL